MEYSFPKIRLGLCCINMTLKYYQDIFSSRKIILKTLENNGVEAAQQVAKENVIDLLKFLFYNKNHGIDVCRITSALVPHASNPRISKFLSDSEAEKFMSLEFLRPYLQLVGDLAKLERMRLTFHPGQFVQIASPNEEVFKNSILELNMHTLFIEMMDLPLDSVMVVHIGGTYGEKEMTTQRFKERFSTIEERIRNRIVLENDEKCYDAEDVLEICEELNVPIVFDIFHYYCYKRYHADSHQKSIRELLPRILATWERRGIRPKFHLSEQEPNLPVGSHSLFVDVIPEELLEIPSVYGIEIDIMIEAKAKDIAIARLYKNYPQIKPKYRKELPTQIPKAAIKDLKVKHDPEVDYLARCHGCHNCPE